MLIDNFLHMDSEGNISMNRKREHQSTLVSHAHSDHIPTKFHDKDLICSDDTRKVIEVRKDRDGLKALPHEDIEFLDAGHTIGSVMFHIKSKDILFTGDFSTTKRYCGQAMPKRVDTLIMEATFGKPEYIFPKYDLIKKEFIDYIKDHKKVSIGVYSFGKAQEICHILDEIKINFSVDKSIKRINQALELNYEHEEHGANVILTKDALDGFKRIGLSGWALKNSYTYQFGLDEAFCLSDHNDFPALVEFAKECNPKKIYTFHGFNIELAASLRKLGFDAEPLLPKGQKMLKNF